LLTEINHDNVNIVTLEDPVEYFLKGINQSQVKPEIGYTFASGLRSFLRQDPDVIMVGEIRDSETVELAIHASLTGHYVYSTLHTNDALGTIPRLLDMGAEPFLLSSTLNTIVAQRLARKICQHCKVESRLPGNMITEIEQEINKIPPHLLKERIKNLNKNGLIFYKGAGCPRCGNTGYSGRVAISEVLDITDELKELIMEKNKKIKTEDVVASQNFITMQQDGIIKVLQGVTSIEEIYRVINN
jgi:type II secretory ATPase GspE/PulE/Tfp pilus assembly ATPase PilB-like protein